MANKEEIQMNALAADVDGMKSVVSKLSEEINSLKKVFEDNNSNGREPMVPTRLPIESRSKDPHVEIYTPVESLEDAIDELNDEVLARTSSINGSITKILNRVKEMRRTQSAMCNCMLEMEERDKEYNKNMKATCEYVTSNPTPKVELTQWQRISLGAKSWFNKEFLTDFRVLVLLFYLVFSSAIAIGYAVRSHNQAKQNATLEYYIEKRLNIPHRK